jgi:hypothetical protein
MSFVIAAPEMMTSAAADLATIGSNVSAAHTAAAAPTLAVMPAGADEVSASIAHLFSQHAQGYQALAGQAAAFHEEFVQNLTASAGSYAATEAANASLLQPLTASAGSFTSAIATLQSQIHNLLNSVNAAWGQLLNSLTGFWNSPYNILTYALVILLSPIILLLLLFTLFIGPLLGQLGL